MSDLETDADATNEAPDGNEPGTADSRSTQSERSPAPRKATTSSGHGLRNSVVIAVVAAIAGGVVTGLFDLRASDGVPESLVNDLTTLQTDKTTAQELAASHKAILSGLQEENKKLLAENSDRDDLKTNNEQLKKENSDLKKMTEDLRSENRRLRSDNRLTEQNLKDATAANRALQEDMDALQKTEAELQEAQTSIAQLKSSLDSAYHLLEQRRLAQDALRAQLRAVSAPVLQWNRHRERSTPLDVLPSFAKDGWRAMRNARDECVSRANEVGDQLGGEVVRSGDGFVAHGFPNVSGTTKFVTVCSSKVPAFTISASANTDQDIRLARALHNAFEGPVESIEWYNDRLEELRANGRRDLSAVPTR